MVCDNILKGYQDLTAVEKNVADYYLENAEQVDFSSRHVASMLFVSEATLSRFAQKVGYTGYRKFIYDYEKELCDRIQERNISVLSKAVRKTYQRLLENQFQLLDESRVRNVAEMLGKYASILICGMGSSGYAAREFYLRFMRLGMNVQAITDSQVIPMSVAMCNDKVLVIGVSLRDAMIAARHRGSATVFITSNQKTGMEDICDEVLYVAADHDLDGGTAISPQFPILMLIDVLYTYYLKNDPNGKIGKWRETLQALFPSETDRIMRRM